MSVMIDSFAAGWDLCLPKPCTWAFAGAAPVPAGKNCPQSSPGKFSAFKFGQERLRAAAVISGCVSLRRVQRQELNLC